MTKHFSIVPTLLLVLASASCSIKTSSQDNNSDARPTDSTGKKAKVSLLLTNLSQPQSISLNSELLSSEIQLGEGLSISDARLNIAAIKLFPSEKDVKVEEKEVAVSLRPESKVKGEETTEEKEIENSLFKGPFVFDLIKKSSDDAPKAAIPDGTYKRIDFQLKKSQASTDDLLDNVFIVKGNVTLDSGVTPFVIKYHVSENVRVLSKDGIKIVGGVDNSLALAFDVSKWLHGIDLKSASVKEGSILIDRSHNQHLLHDIKKNIKQSVRVGLDKDKDAKLNQDEIQANSSEEI